MRVIGFRAATVLSLLVPVKAFQVNSSLRNRGYRPPFPKYRFNDNHAERTNHSSSSQTLYLSADSIVNVLSAAESSSSTISSMESLSNGFTLAALFTCVIFVASLLSEASDENQISSNVMYTTDTTAEDWSIIYAQATARANLEVSAQESRDKIQQAKEIKKRKALQQEMEKKKNDTERSTIMKMKQQDDAKKAAILKAKQLTEKAANAAIQEKKLKEEETINAAILKIKREKEAERAALMMKREEEERKLKQAQEEAFLKLQLKREAEEASKKARRDMEVRLESESRKRQSLATAKAATVAAKIEIERAKSERALELEVENKKQAKRQSADMNVKSIIQEKIEEVVSDVEKNFKTSIHSQTLRKNSKSVELLLDDTNVNSKVENKKEVDSQAKETTIDSNVEEIDKASKDSLSLRSMIKRRSVIVAALAIVVAQRLIRIYVSRGLV